jgi:four helix bundle protein
MQDFRQLKAWEKGHALALAVYGATRNFPPHELYGLTGQMCRSSASVPTNIAEGCGRSSIADFRKFLDYAMGSAKELEYQLLLSRDLGYLPAGDHERMLLDVAEVQRMLAGFMTRLRPAQ